MLFNRQACPTERPWPELQGLKIRCLLDAEAAWIQSPAQPGRRGRERGTRASPSGCISCCRGCCQGSVLSLWWPFLFLEAAATKSQPTGPSGHPHVVPQDDGAAAPAPPTLHTLHSSNYVPHSCATTYYSNPLHKRSEPFCVVLPPFIYLKWAPCWRARCCSKATHTHVLLPWFLHTVSLLVQRVHHR